MPGPRPTRPSSSGFPSSTRTGSRRSWRVARPRSRCVRRGNGVWEERPATWCEAHHQQPWSQGGKTELADGVLLCSWHHHRAHDRRFHADKLANGDIRFHRRR
ncbi:HNH endonuclease [Nocardioides antri]|uniref:HNH endonuclease n=1 Tax=Nocardioides antri TaxID=2607659 RepID=UPI0034CE9A80